jgi:hypothetical protein
MDPRNERGTYERIGRPTMSGRKRRLKRDVRAYWVGYWVKFLEGRARLAYYYWVGY